MLSQPHNIDQGFLRRLACEYPTCFLSWLDMALLGPVTEDDLS
jgi:hypothetical protein